MIALITFFLIAVIVSTTAVWLYRFISGWQGFNQITVRNYVPRTKGWLKPDRRFGSMASPARGRVKSIALSNTRGDIKVPWGW